jgi:hypothetical protein
MSSGVEAFSNRKTPSSAVSQSCLSAFSSNAGTLDGDIDGLFLLSMRGLKNFGRISFSSLTKPIIRVKV